MIMRYRNPAMAVAMAVTGLLLPCSPATASPYCIEVTGLPAQCMYADAAECSKRAAQLGGVCSANPDELVIPPGGSRFCVVGPNIGAQCIYSDRDSCQNAASQLGGACSENTKATVQPNPYSEEPNKAY